MSTVAERIRDVFADAGARGRLHAADVHDEDNELGVDADERVALASVYKLFVLAAFVRAVDRGDVDPRGRVTLTGRTRTAGATGVAALRDDVTLSWRDAVHSMITVSDNACADAVTGLLGRRAVRDTTDALGLVHTAVTDDSRRQLRHLLRDTDTTTEADAYRVLADLDRAVEPSGYDPVHTSSSTSRDTTRLLRALWTDTAASPAQCAFARATLAGAVGPHRLRLGFPGDDPALAHKTGTLGALRHDAGVFDFGDGCSFAVAVFTRAARPDRFLPRVEAAIGDAARLAVDRLHTARHDRRHRTV